MASFLARALALPSAGADYFDDAGLVHEPSIHAMATAGITNGCGSAGTSFCPAAPIIREHMAAFLFRAVTE